MEMTANDRSSIALVTIWFRIGSEMTKSLCPAGCGQKYISKEHAEAHADAAHPDWRVPKARGWATPHGFVDFQERVTYDHACKVAERLHKLGTQNENIWDRK